MMGQTQLCSRRYVSGDCGAIQVRNEALLHQFQQNLHDMYTVMGSM